MIPKWENFPERMRNEYVRKHYKYLSSKKISLIFKRLFDIIFSVILILTFMFPMLMIGILIKITSDGKVLYKQKRVTQYGRIFEIYKFRTMQKDADKSGLLTHENDSRITSVGKILRKFRIDELPQMFNVLFGDMTFVGTRPEVKKYVDKYDSEMLSTLILPAGITSLASIEFRDEDRLLKDEGSIDEIYIKSVLPRKMKYNIDYLNRFSLLKDAKVIVLTFLKIFKLMR